MNQNNIFPINLKSLSDKERHDYVLKTYILNQQYVEQQRKHKRDIDVIREHHRFLWEDGTDEPTANDWELRLARRYYDKLFKEYCIADLTRFKDNKIALRWRTEAEVVSGIGQFQCGSRKCLMRDELRSWEVNFAYQEQGIRKNALVKLRLCPEHTSQLNYTSKKREIKRMRRQQQKLTKREEIRLKKGKNKKQTESHTNNIIVDEVIEQKVASEVDSTSAETNVKSIDDETNMQLVDNDDIWRKKIVIAEESENNREIEFERYLEDLLM